MMRSDPQLEYLLAPAIAALGLGVVLWGVEFQPGARRALLRVYIDAPGRQVGIDDCEAVSREIGALLDLHDPIPGNYTLEVSSPGLDRPLFHAAQFPAFLGERVRLGLAAPQHGRRRVEGRLLAADGQRLQIEVDGCALDFDLAGVLKARLAPLFEAPVKPGKTPRRPSGGTSTPTPRQA